MVFDRINDRLYSERDFEVRQTNEELFESLQEKTPSEPLLYLRPNKENPGMENARAFVQNLYNHRTKGQKNVSPVNSFEIWFDEGKIKFYIHPDTAEQRNRLHSHIKDKYPGTRIQQKKAPFPKINKGDYIAGGRLTLENDYPLPIRMPNESGRQGLDRDPFGDLTSEMVVESEWTSDGEQVNPEDVRMMTQIVFKPISKNWTKGGGLWKDFLDYADTIKNHEEIKGGLFSQLTREAVGVEQETRDPTAKKKKTARTVTELRGEPGFQIRVRIICISEYPEVVTQHVKGTAEVFSNYYNPITEQGFEVLEFEESEIEGLLEKMAARKISKGSVFDSLEKLTSRKDVVSAREMAGIVHIPNHSINTPFIEWNKTESGSGVPADMPDKRDIVDKIENDEEGGEGNDRMVSFDPSSPTDTDPVEDLKIEVEDSQQEEQISGDGTGFRSDELIEPESAAHDPEADGQQEQEQENIFSKVKSRFSKNEDTNSSEATSETASEDEDTGWNGETEGSQSPESDSSEFTTESRGENQTGGEDDLNISNDVVSEIVGTDPEEDDETEENETEKASGGGQSINQTAPTDRNPDDQGSTTAEKDNPEKTLINQDDGDETEGDEGDEENKEDSPITRDELPDSVKDRF